MDKCPITLLALNLSGPLVTSPCLVKCVVNFLWFLLNLIGNERKGGGGIGGFWVGGGGEV